MITATNGGMQAWIDELEIAADNLPQMMLPSLVARQKVIEEAIKQSWVNEGGTPGGFVYSSVGQSANFSLKDKNDVIGTIGVYNIDSIKSQFGRTDRDINAAQIAYWVELGTSRLKSGGRKPSGKNIPEDMLVVVAPRSFISTAVNNSWSSAEKAFNKKFNEEYERLVK